MDIRAGSGSSVLLLCEQIHKKCYMFGKERSLENLWKEQTDKIT